MNRITMTLFLQRILQNRNHGNLIYTTIMLIK